MATNSTNSPSIYPKKENVTNGYTSDDSLLGEEPQVRMRVGEMFQAKVPCWDEGTKSPHSKEGMLIWSPCDSLSNEKLECYCKTAKDKHSYNMEQALGMLFWHKHNITKSLSDMQNFTPMPDEWSMEDKVLFEQAYAFHGKNFRKVQQLIPDKEIGQLVKFYYTWKKSRMKTSVMDKQANKSSGKNGNCSDDSMQEDNSEPDDQKLPLEHVQSADEDIKHKLPKGIVLSKKDMKLFEDHEKGPEGFLADLDDQLIEEKRKIQVLRQECSADKDKLQEIDRPSSSLDGDEKQENKLSEIKDEENLEPSILS